jgi:BirA family biotin operon repressor/biotin-[acetyl-CoA-carboxylase] ligase
LALDALAGRPARVLRGDDSIAGVARGVDAGGALRLERVGRIEEFVSGEVSLRLSGDDL